MKISKNCWFAYDKDTDKGLIRIESLINEDAYEIKFRVLINGIVIYTSALKI